MPTKKPTTNAAGAKRVTRSAAAAPSSVAVRPKQLYRKEADAPKQSKGDSDKEKCAGVPQ